MLSGRGLCDELITRSEESYRLCCFVVCDLETSRIGAPYIYDIVVSVCCECRVLSGRVLCDELITRPEESYGLCCVVVCDLETSRIGAPYIYIYIYIYDISSLRVNYVFLFQRHQLYNLCDLQKMEKDM